MKKLRQITNGQVKGKVVKGLYEFDQNFFMVFQDDTFICFYKKYEDYGDGVYITIGRSVSLNPDRNNLHFLRKIGVIESDTELLEQMERIKVIDEKIAEKRERELLKTLKKKYEGNI